MKWEIREELVDFDTVSSDDCTTSCGCRQHEKGTEDPMIEVVGGPVNKQQCGVSGSIVAGGTVVVGLRCLKITDGPTGRYSAIVPATASTGRQQRQRSKARVEE